MAMDRDTLDQAHWELSGAAYSAHVGGVSWGMVCDRWLPHTDSMGRIRLQMQLRSLQQQALDARSLDGMDSAERTAALEQVARESRARSFNLIQVALLPMAPLPTMPSDGVSEGLTVARPSTLLVPPMQPVEEGTHE